MSKRKPLFHCPSCGKDHRPIRRKPLGNPKTRICDECWAKAMKRKRKA
jgi:hypothetical protein